MPKLTLRHKDATANVCMEALDVDEYFKLFEETLKMHDLMDSPCQIYNVYETGSDFMMNEPLNVNEKEGRKRYVMSPDLEITVVCCIHAAGQAIPHLLSLFFFICEGLPDQLH